MKQERDEVYVVVEILLAQLSSGWRCVSRGTMIAHSSECLLNVSRACRWASNVFIPAVSLACFE